MYNSKSNYYFDWLIKIVDDPIHSSDSYIDILSYLADRKFFWILSMDENRAYDGVMMREIYLEKEIPFETNETFKSDDCSVLEMMIGLASRIESDFMADPTIGDRTAKWFWQMMKSLGLDHMKDTNYDPEKAEEIVDIFLNRQYKPNGKGSLFYVENTKLDLRNFEIWAQLNVWLNQSLG